MIHLLVVNMASQEFGVEATRSGDIELANFI